MSASDKIDSLEWMKFRLLPDLVKEDLAMHLDGYGGANWQLLAEVLGCPPLKISWYQFCSSNTNTNSGSPTLHFFRNFCEPNNFSLPTILNSLEKIQNKACVDILTNYILKLKMQTAQNNPYQVPGTDLMLPLKRARQCEGDKLREHERKLEGIHVFLTYSNDNEAHIFQVSNLVNCMKKNGFIVKIDLDDRCSIAHDRLGWLDKQFHEADFILILISPLYLREVSSADPIDIPNPTDRGGSDTRYIHRMMQAEYIKNSCSNRRFIPVVMPGSTRNDVPTWLQNTIIYSWPGLYKQLFIYLMSYAKGTVWSLKQKQRISNNPTVKIVKN